MTAFDRIRERTSPEIKQRVKYYCDILVALSNEEACLLTGAMQGEYDDILSEYQIESYNINSNINVNIKW